MKPKNIKQMQSDSRHLKVRRIGKNTFSVESASDPATQHVVTVIFDAGHVIQSRCNCAWAQHGGVACSHVMAALEYLADLKGRRLSFWLTQADARRQKNRMFFLTGTRSVRERLRAGAQSRFAAFEIVPGKKAEAPEADEGNKGVWVTSRSA